MHRRALLTFALASGGLVAAGDAWAAPELDGEAVRLADRNTLRLSWSPSASPVTLFGSQDPDAPRAARRLIKAGGHGGEMTLDAPVSPRPYFLVTTGDGGQLRLAERLLPLQGGRNFRDLGGYRAAGGRQVRWGKLFRSGVMSGLTAGDVDYLHALGLNVVCDLRSVQERQAEPSPFLSAGAPKVVAFDYDLHMNMAQMASASTADQAVAAFATSYVGFLDVLKPQFTDMFAHLVKGDAPLAINCSAGKDRTGLASALILSVLGAPRETVVADYALTQVYTPPGPYLKAMASGGHVSGLTPEQAQAMARMPRGVLEIMVGSDPRVMRQALAMVDATYGGPIPLAKAKYGLTDAGVARLRSLYLI